MERISNPKKQIAYAARRQDTSKVSDAYKTDRLKYLEKVDE